jgi:hypothetical protein
MKLKPTERSSSTVRERYGYLNDDLPDEVWIWEFARRTNEYRQAFDHFKSLEGTVFEAPPRNPAEGKFFSFLGAAYDAGIQSTGVGEEFESDHHAKVTFWWAIEGHERCLVHLAFPDYHYPFKAFTGTDKEQQISVRQWRPYKVAVGMGKTEGLECALDPETGKRLLIDPFRRPFRKGTSDYDAFVETYLSDCVRMEDTIFVGISKDAKDSDLEALLKVVRSHLRPSRVRNHKNKWKYYLIAYDLDQEGKELKDIADLLNSTYGEVAADERDVKRYRKEALDLIVGRKYLKYLRIHEEPEEEE